MMPDFDERVNARGREWALVVVVLEPRFSSTEMRAGEVSEKAYLDELRKRLLKANITQFWERKVVAPHGMADLRYFYPVASWEMSLVAYLSPDGPCVGAAFGWSGAASEAGRAFGRMEMVGALRRSSTFLDDLPWVTMCFNAAVGLSAEELARSICEVCRLVKELPGRTKCLPWPDRRPETRRV
jgi:hypothetical protein